MCIAKAIPNDLKSCYYAGWEFKLDQSKIIMQLTNINENKIHNEVKKTNKTATHHMQCTFFQTERKYISSAEQYTRKPEHRPKSDHIFFPFEYGYFW